MQKFSPQALAALLPLFLVAACAQSYEPVVDPKGVNMAVYNADLVECRQLAEKVDVGGDAAKSSLIGGVGGAALGAALGAITGSAGIGAAVGATTGVAGGAGSAGLSGAERQKTIINNCLKGRGYRVLG